MSTLWPLGLQHTRLSCSSLSARLCSNSCALSWWCHPTISSFSHPLPSCLQSFPASGSFPWVRSSHQVAKVLELQLQHQSFQWIFSVDLIDWFDLLFVQGTLKSLLQHHRLKAPILWDSAFFMAHLSQPYTTTGKTIALTIWTFAGKVMSRFVIAFLPRNKHLFIPCQSSSTVMWSPRK